MENVKKTFRQKLKEAGYSSTKQRQIVFEHLYVTDNPYTMGKLCNELKTQIDRATIYRIIGLFEQLSITKRIYTGWKYHIELSDNFKPHHHHLICTDCHQLTPIDEPREIDNILTRIESAYGVKIVSHDFELHILCASCREKKAYATI